MNRHTASGAMLTLLLIGILTSTFNVHLARTRPITIIVPDDFPTIREAANRAKDGDFIYVRSGTYFEKEVTITRPLTLIGENKSTTFIDGDGAWVCVYIKSTYNVIVSGFTIQNGYGIYLYRSENVTVSENIISNNGQGIILLESADSTISRNIVTLNGAMSIFLSGSSNNRILENIVTLNSGSGFWIDYSSHNSISRNNITSNDRGIALHYSSNNEFYHNSLVGNKQQVHIYSSGYASIWDVGFPSGGNYWSDQYHGSCADHFSGSGQDTPGSDGIVDVPYVIDTENRDNYPLMEPWSLVPATVEIYPETLSLHSLFGRWIKAYIELPERYDVSDIDISTVMLNDEVPAEIHPTNMGDYDNDGIPDLMVKFSRIAAMKSIFRTGENTLTINGEVSRSPL